MKTKFGIVGCGFLRQYRGRCVEEGTCWKTTSWWVSPAAPSASAEKTAASVGRAACADVDALLALEPEYIVEAASVEAVRAMAVPVLRRGVNLVVLSIGAFADLAFYKEVKQAAREGGAKVHLASGAIGGFDVLQTVTLMAEALKLDEKAGIETSTGAKGFRNTPCLGRPSADRHREDYRLHRQRQGSHRNLPAPGQRRCGHLTGHHRPLTSPA